MNISDSLKEKFINRDGEKLVRIIFPSLNLTLENANIYADTLTIKESIMSGQSIEFVGCIASTMSVDLHGVTAKLKGQRIEVYMTIGNWTEYIPVFKGYVDSVKTRLSDSYKSITCYDDLYYKITDKDVAAWYSNLTFPITMLNFRNSLFNYLGVQQNLVELPNDAIEIKREYVSNQMNAIDMVKNICQFNGVFGIMNRDGLFDYIELSRGSSNGAYPSSYTYPSLILYPKGQTAVQDSSSGTTIISYYKEMEYEDFDVYPIDKVLIRDGEDDAGVSYGTGNNVYIVQSNIFAYKLTDEVKAVVAQNIYNNVAGFRYKPFNAEAIGLPFIELGSVIEFNIADYTGQQGQFVRESFILMNRTLKGIQGLTDTYSADGEQYQNIFISDIGSKLDSLEMKVANACTVDQMQNYVDSSMGTYPTVDQVSEIVADEVSQMEIPTGFNVISTYTLPSSRSANTIYLIQGGVIIQ